MPFVFANVLEPLITVCEQVLLFFHDTVGTGWGLAIICLTLTVRVLLLPLTLKQMHSMRRMQLLAPEIKKIQAKYKDDKQRQQQEMMRFYQENKVNPLASCLPLLFQLPFFFALYFMLRTDLRQDICGQTAKACGEVVPHSAQFLFVPDLTAPATGSTLVVLIILYVGSQIASGLLSSATMDKNQRLLMLGLPLLFVTFVIRFPAGLMVYWITTNCWTIVQGLIVRRSVGPMPTVAKGVPAPAAAAAMAGGDGASAKGAGRAKKEKAAPAPAAAQGSANGAGASGGPPPSARKKKKRTGRRR
jgi:YidC/Oxa1 family membrane protein insertase